MYIYIYILYIYIYTIYTYIYIYIYVCVAVSACLRINKWRKLRPALAQKSRLNLGDPHMFF